MERAAACLTDVGRVRDHNEDCVGADLGLGLWVVADGLGGHEAGEIASALAVAEIPRFVAEGSTLAEAVEQCHELIRQAPAQGVGVPGMGATVVAAQLGACGEFQVCWVGDSRAYVFGAGGLRQVTVDHSYVQDLVNADLITPEEALTHPQRNVVTQCLGSEALATVEVGRVTGRLQEGEVLLLCSDGLTGEVSDGDIAAVLDAEGSLEEKAQRLVEEANANGGSDNITVALIPAGAGADAGVGGRTLGTRKMEAVGPPVGRRVAVGVAAAVLLVAAGSFILSWGDPFSRNVDEPPPKPAAPIVTLMRPDSVTLTWDEPSVTGGPAISAYEMRYQKSDASEWTDHTLDSMDFRTVIGSLESGATYRVQVLAKNDEGSSEWSDFVEFDLPALQTDLQDGGQDGGDE